MACEWNRLPEIRETVYRPSPEVLPDLPLPYFPRSAGCFRLGKGVEERVPAGVKHFVQFFWVTGGEGEFFRGGAPHSVSEGDCFYHLPDEEHHHRATGTVWEYRWIVFDGAGAAPFLNSFGYPPDGFHAGACPEDLFVEFEARMRERTPFAWREMAALICRILARAGGGETDSRGELAFRAAALCREEFYRASLNVNTLAERLGVERSTLLRHFQAAMRLSPSEYLTQQRVQCALSLLKQTRLPLAEVARRCGFADVNYFCRVIRRRVGTSPARFRVQ